MTYACVLQRESCHDPVTNCSCTQGAYSQRWPHANLGVPSFDMQRYGLLTGQAQGTQLLCMCLQCVGSFIAYGVFELKQSYWREHMSHMHFALFPVPTLLMQTGWRLQSYITQSERRNLQLWCCLVAVAACLQARLSSNQT